MLGDHYFLLHLRCPNVARSLDEHDFTVYPKQGVKE